MPLEALASDQQLAARGWLAPIGEAAQAGRICRGRLEACSPWMLRRAAISAAGPRQARCACNQVASPGVQSNWIDEPPPRRTMAACQESGREPSGGSFSQGGNSKCLAPNIPGRGVPMGSSRIRGGLAEAEA